MNKTLKKKFNNSMKSIRKYYHSKDNFDFTKNILEKSLIPDSSGEGFGEFIIKEKWLPMISINFDKINQIFFLKIENEMTYYKSFEACFDYLYDYVFEEKEKVESEEPIINDLVKPDFSTFCMDKSKKREYKKLQDKINYRLVKKNQNGSYIIEVVSNESFTQIGKQRGYRFSPDDKTKQKINKNDLVGMEYKFANVKKDIQ